MTAQAGMPLDFWEQVRKVAAEEVAKYARSGPARNSSVTGGAGTTIGDGGAFIIDGGDFIAQYPAAEGGGVAVKIGPQYSNTGTYLGTGLLVQAPNGTDMLVARQDAQFNNTRWDLYDDGNRVIVGNDAATGQGLARPYLPAAFYRKRYADMTVSTTSATFETLWEAQIHKQLPRMEVGTRATMDTSGATGELQVLVNGVLLGAVATEGFAITSRTFGPEHVAGSHMDVLTVEIQGRVTSGTGALRVEPRSLVLRQSP